MLITRMTPKISVRPEASRAYVPPISRPRTIVWTNWVTRRDDASLRARLPARDDLVGRRGLVGQHDLGLAVLPLADEELALRAAVLGPAQRAEDRVDRVLAQPVGELELVVDRADAVDGRGHHLGGGVGVGGVLGHLGAAEHLLVLGDELLVARGLGVDRVAHLVGDALGDVLATELLVAGGFGVARVADRVEDALGVVLADRLRVLVAERRRGRLVEPL